MRKTIQKRRSLRVRKKIKKSNTDRFRLSVNRSSRNISAQIIDDVKSITLVSASSIKEKAKNVKKKPPVKGAFC